MIYRLTDISKTYGTRNGNVCALNDLSFEVQRGERVALLGPSGAGKTTLFRLLNATLRPTSGHLQFDDRDLTTLPVRELRAIRLRIGTIYQQPHLVPSLSALQNTLCGKLGSWSLTQSVRTIIRPTRQDAQRALVALESVGLADKRDARADELSGGQQQRLTIARVLMQDPEVILADEPFASLDPGLTETVAALLMDLLQNGSRTLVATMHDVDRALEFFHRIIAISDGRMIFDSPARAVDRLAIDALYAGEVADPDKLKSFLQPQKVEPKRESARAR